VLNVATVTIGPMCTIFGRDSPRYTCTWSSNLHCIDFEWG